MKFSDKDIEFMQIALVEANRALLNDEVPIGAIIVKDNVVISKAHNMVEENKHSLKHAELIAIENAINIINDKYLNDCTLYCTLEPCSMCAGAIINSRIKRLYFGAMDLKAGATGSVYNIVNDNKLNHKVETYGGLLETECSNLLKEFFKNKRYS